MFIFSYVIYSPTCLFTFIEVLCNSAFILCSFVYCCSFCRRNGGDMVQVRPGSSLHLAGFSSPLSHFSPYCPLLSRSPFLRESVFCLPPGALSVATAVSRRWRRAPGHQSICGFLPAVGGMATGEEAGRKPSVTFWFVSVGLTEPNKRIFFTKP